MLNKKIELDILVEHTKDGRSLPKTILWDDGRRFDIDKILDIRQATTLKCGGAGMKLYLQNLWQTACIFNEEDKWFVEK